jgi:hypothetical protein
MKCKVFVTVNDKVVGDFESATNDDDKVWQAVEKWVEGRIGFEVHPVTQTKFKHLPDGTTTCKLILPDGPTWVGRSSNPDRKQAEAEALLDARQRQIEDRWFRDDEGDAQ